MTPRPFQLEPLHRKVFFGVFGVLFASGLVWWLADEATEDAMRRVAWAEAAKPWMLRLHGAAAMAFLVVMGTVLSAHVGRAWANGVNRRTGLSLGVWLFLLTVTGYGLYFGGDKLREWTGTVHVTLGLLVPLALVAHVLRGRSLVRQSKP